MMHFHRILCYDATATELSEVEIDDPESIISTQSPDMETDTSLLLDHMHKLKKLMDPPANLTTTRYQ